MNDDFNYLKKQHILNYKNMITQMILNNNNSLFDEDINSLLKEPPLESMDIIKNNLISIAKKNNTIIDSDIYNDVINKYRENLYKISNDNKQYRLNFYNDIVNCFNFDNNNNETIKVLKKDTNNLNKEIRKRFKDGIIDSIDKYFSNNIDKLFIGDIQNIEDIKEKFLKFMNTKYINQLLENIDIKILVKDTILINNIKEEGEKYLYTLNNSHLFD